MNSLNVIQTLAKIGKIISRIIYILCCVGFWASLVSVIIYALAGEGALKIGGTSILGPIQSKADLSALALCGHIAGSAVICAAEAFVARRATKYFENELKDGTPFTYDGSKELLKLGITTIVLPICAVIICSIGFSIAGHINPELTKPEWIENTTSTGMGIAMILISLLCRYGSELADSGRLEAPAANQGEEGKTV